MNKTFLQKKNKYNIILVLVVLAVICIVFLYTVFSNKQMEKYVGNMVEQMTQGISNEIDAYTCSAISSIQLTSHLATQTLSDSALDDVNEVLNPLLEQTPFNFIEYIERDGTNTTDAGEKFDASDRIYYKEGILGNTGIWINYHPKYAKEYLLNFYTPLYIDDDIVGVITGTLGADTNVLPIIQTNIFDKDVVGILCDENKRVISATIELENDAYLEDLLNSFEVKEQGKREFYSHFDSLDDSTFQFVGKRGKAIACVVTNDKTGWRTIQIVPASLFQTFMHQGTSGAYLVTGVISFLLLVYLLYIRMDLRKKTKELIDEKDRIVKNYAQILTATASDTYLGIRRLNFETCNFEYIYFDNNNIYQTPKGDWMIWLELQRKNVHPDDYDRVHDFLSINHLNQMVEGKTYRESYRSALKDKDGYYRTYTTTASILYVDGKKNALMTTIDNSEAVAREIRQKQLLASAASIYLSMHVLDLKNNTMEVLNCAEHISNVVGEKRDNIQELLRDTMRKLTNEQYIDSMMEFIDFRTLDKRMEGVKTITLEFIGNMSGWCRARFIAVDYDDDHLLRRVLWVIENIDAEKKKTNRLLYLSETDLMTGIRNRGSGERKIKDLIVTRHQGMFCLLDVDKFKSVNDSYGHGVGDKVLIAIADCMKESFRESDVILRLGGDEFAFFADGITDEAMAAPLVEAFFDKIDHIDIPELQDGKITVSLGAAFKVDKDGLDFEGLYHNADSCTYKSKKRKGNACTYFKG